eukprot:GHUV01016815.1.p1 GENE.GHUV01016815.1~~GHUV01016815.1.p1  ORF type:complete len:526 (+),score=156.68 GHUV01016815.1:200-1777(+)
MSVGTEHDVAVPTLIPPQLPALLFGSRRSYSCRPPGPERPPGLGWLPVRQEQQQQQPQPQQMQQLRQQINNKNSTSSNRRITPTASGDKGSNGSTSCRPAVDILFKAIGGTGIGAGAGGIFCGPSHALTVRLWPLPGRKVSVPADEKHQKTVLIMMSNTGGGHKASAEALQQAFQEKYGDKYKVLIVDMWKEHTPRPFNNMPDSYSFLVHHGMLWRMAYHSIQPRAVHIPYLSAMYAFVGKHLSDAFDRYDPDLVVSVHPLMQHVNCRALAARAKRLGRAAPTPFATVVTDFTTCHNTWFCKSVDKCFVPTEFCRQLGKRMGLSDDQLVLYGLPIRPVFDKKLPAKNTLRKKLGLLPDVPAILLVGGGEGMGKLQATVEQLDAKLQGSAQIAVICGRNKKLLQKLQSHRWPGGSHVVPCGFVNNIHEWMGAVDTIITKAGPGTIAEALISGLPILLNGNVPCQVRLQTKQQVLLTSWLTSCTVSHVHISKSGALGQVPLSTAILPRLYKVICVSRQGLATLLLHA